MAWTSPPRLTAEGIRVASPPGFPADIPNWATIARVAARLDLAPLLRLRPPTVVHHLNILRLAGLVEVMVHSEGERAYALRREALEHTTANLSDFILLPR